MASAELDGADEFVAKLAQFEARVTGDRSDVDQASAQELLRVSRLGVPYRSGRLWRSGRVSVENRAGVVRYGGPGVPWAGPAEGGDENRPQGGSIRAARYLSGSVPVARPRIVDIHDRDVADKLRASGLT